MERLSFFSGIFLVAIVFLNIPDSWRLVAIAILGVILIIVSSLKMWNKK